MLEGSNAICFKVVLGVSVKHYLPHGDEVVLLVGPDLCVYVCVCDPYSIAVVYIICTRFLLGGGRAFAPPPPLKTFCPPLENSKFQF